MSLIIPKEIIDGITFEANYDIYKDTLLRLDTKRFRGLGDDNVEKFIRHASKYAEEIELTYVNDIAYLMMMMSYLGSTFYEDFRYSKLVSCLNNKNDFEDYRIEKTREEFIKIGDQFLGKRLSKYIKALSKFVDSVLPKIDDNSIEINELPHKLIGCFETNVISEQQAWFSDKLVSCGDIAAKELKIETDRGQKICTSLAFWLGAGFYKDPLYPWVADKTSDQNMTDDERIDNLKAFAKKRLMLQIQSWEKING